MSLVIARNELRRIFLTPLAWVLLAAVLGVLGYFFLLSLGAFLALMPKIAGMADAPGVTDLVVLPLLRATASLLSSSRRCWACARLPAIARTRASSCCSPRASAMRAS